MLIKECSCCGRELYAGEEVVYSKYGDDHFCDMVCAEKFVISYLPDFLDVFQDDFTIKRTKRFMRYIKRNWEKIRAFESVKDQFGMTKLEESELDFDDWQLA